MKKLSAATVLAYALFAGQSAQAQEANGCPAGSYSVVISPDGATLSILFDQFAIESPGASAGAPTTKACRISAPLKLAENYSIGVYKVDYRGFAKLAARQGAQLDVQYFLGPHDNQHGRVFKRTVRGPHENDYSFTETIGRGQMKQVGCGAAAVLEVSITLGLEGDLQSGQAMASLDSSDGAPTGALVYHLNLVKCPGAR
jgi:hypothetical protein